MKKMKLITPHYQELLQAFSNWLFTLNYAENTQTTWKTHVQEYLYFHENNGIKHISRITPKAHQAFQLHVKHRKNETQGGGLSQFAVNKILTSINAFRKFLSFSTHYQIDVGYFDIKEASSTRTILTIQEVKELYEASFRNRREDSLSKGQRERVLLAVYYGCGLRLSEGIKLNLSDIDTDNKMLLVREGKGNKSRQVPIARQHNEDIKRYIEEGREWFTINHTQSYYDKNQKKQNIDNDALFLNQYGQRMQSSGMYHMLKLLKENTAIDKRITLHGLRHSIATHLLASGLALENIKSFLGHATLESTQLYLHIAQENDNVQEMVSG